MARTNRWGITLPLHGLSLSAQREMVTALPVLGYTDAWSAELAGVDAFSPLVLASQWAPELRLGKARGRIYPPAAAPRQAAFPAGRADRGEGHPAVRDVLGERVPPGSGPGSAAGPGPGGA